MPAVNLERRRRLTDAALELIARAGLHGLTHRALDRHAGEPTGTASNYFPTRDDLLIAAMQRGWELHLAEMNRLAPPPAVGRTPRASLADAVDQIAASLVDAATVQRDRNIALVEMQSEVRRRPDLAAALAQLQGQAARDNHAFHVAHGLAVPADSVPALQVLFGGALLALLARPAEQVTLQAARPLAEAMIYGVRRPAASRRDT